MEKRTVKVVVEISKQLHDMMLILDREGIKSIEEFLREGLPDRVDNEFERYLKRRKEYKRPMGE